MFIYFNFFFYKRFVMYLTFFKIFTRQLYRLEITYRWHFDGSLFPPLNRFYRREEKLPKKQKKLDKFEKLNLVI